MMTLKLIGIALAVANVVLLAGGLYGVKQYQQRRALTMHGTKLTD